MQTTKIEWADHTFNPWIGCTKISPACENCYAQVQQDQRFSRVKWGAGEARSRTSAANWKQPLKWNREALKAGVRPFVFCASLADVFDNEVEEAWRSDLFDLIERTPQLVWLLLTKRIGNVTKMVEKLPRNVALGATMANQVEYDRDAPKLLKAAEQLKPLFTFGSFEPLLGPIELSKATAPDWIIVGGESGHGARPMDLDWARSLRDQTERIGSVFNFKQTGAVVGHGSELLDGKRHFDRPEPRFSELPRSAANDNKTRTFLMSKPTSFLDGQVYRLNDDGSGKPAYFDVPRMVEFAERNLQIEPLKVDPGIAEAMLRHETVNADHVMRLVRFGQCAPIIVCVGAAKDGKGLIVDGNHRFVAVAYLNEGLGCDGIIPAYFFEEQQWRRFVLSEAVVSIMGLTDPSQARKSMLS